jgi:hypothetical protein
VLAVVGMGDPLSTHEPNGYGSGHKIKSMTGPRFFSRHILCLWACVWIEKNLAGLCGTQCLWGRSCGASGPTAVAPNLGAAFLCNM